MRGILGKPLTERETKILCEWGNGAGMKEIAAAWNMSRQNVETILNTARCKIGYYSLAHVVKWLAKRGLITLDLPAPSLFAPWYQPAEKKLKDLS